MQFASALPPLCWACLPPSTALSGNHRPAHTASRRDSHVDGARCRHNRVGSASLPDVSFAIRHHNVAEGRTRNDFTVVHSTSHYPTSNPLRHWSLGRGDDLVKQQISKPGVASSYLRSTIRFFLLMRCQLAWARR